MTGNFLERHGEQFLHSLASPLASTTRTIAFTGITVVTYVLLVLSSFPEYSIQLLAANPWYLDDAIVALTANTYATTGAVGLGLIVAYAVLTGVAVTNVVTQVRWAGRTGTGGLVSVLPGLVVSGCASCGAGVLGLLGFAGALAMFPFDGNLLRAGGVVLLCGFLARTGNPRYCRVDQEQ